MDLNDCVYVFWYTNRILLFFCCIKWKILDNLFDVSCWDVPSVLKTMPEGKGEGGKGDQRT